MWLRSTRVWRIEDIRSAGNRLLLFSTIAALSAAASPVAAQVCVPGVIHGYVSSSDTVPAARNCFNLWWCHPPQLTLSGYEPRPPGCDPTLGPCGVRANVDGVFPGNKGNSLASGFFDSPIKLTWTDSGGGFVGSCGNAGGRIQDDKGIVWIEAGNFSCANPQGATGTDTYTLTALQCDGACPQQRSLEVPLTPEAMSDALCPPPPPPWGCKEGTGGCQPACLGPGGGGGAGGGGAGGGGPGAGPGGDGGGGGGSSVGGGGPGAAPAGSGPGALLYYQAGGAGHPSYPKPAGWNATLGRYWSHDYAEAIIEDPDAGHVWLITRWATFREFTDGDGDGDYETVVPSDEYRRLTKTAEGWELRDLDGTVQGFDADGRWTATVDRSGNAKLAVYSGDQLSQVVFPDGRIDSFGYHPDGKLASITEVGVGASDSRAWGYAWSGDDLVRIDRPDGTAWAFRYDDPAHPGYLTRMTLVGTDAGERIAGAWEVDDRGNVVRTWRGAADFVDPQAVDRWSLSFDDPKLPAVTTVTDPLGNVSTYVIGRDPASTKPRVVQISGDCPTCGLGPNTQLSYDDPLNPMRRTEEIDGTGTVTRYAYDVDGQLTSRIEAFGTALERDTTWQYEPTFPALVTEISRPSTSGDPLDLRRTVVDYDGAGNPIGRTIEGVEDGAAFSYETVTTYNAAGRPETVDPPGYGLSDVTTFTYDPARGDLLPDTRTDPLIGTTVFAYDAFNRRTGVTDPNGVTTETVYDNLDRVRFVVERGSTPAEDLVTEHLYNAFGDLFQTILPRGNVIEYGYDQAGRLITIERKPDADPASHGERTVYELDGFGHRVRQSLERWDGAAWVREAETAFEYATRCQLERMISGVDSGEESVTEYAYDCDGNLERMWDPNHPSAGQTNPPSTSYVYDELGRLTDFAQPWGGAGGGDAVTRYAYDVQDHLTAVTDAEGTLTVYEYSDRDLLVREISEVSGTTTHTYNAHGELETTLDERGILTTRTLDALDRVTRVSWPGDPSLTIDTTWDDPLVAYSLGRLTRISRHGIGVDYEYDAFGRITRDGDLGYGYDDNGNRVTVVYPGGATATYGYDFADRQETLDVQVGAGPPRPVVSAAGYLPSGPLTSLTLGNGAVETRRFDRRYHPDSIAVTGARSRTWDYETDAVGNVTRIDDILDCASSDLVLSALTVATTEVFESCGELTVGPDFHVVAPGDVTLRAAGGIVFESPSSVGQGAALEVEANADLALPVASSRTFNYQDYQYYLTSAAGPWGTLGWTYDQAGSRLAEDRNGTVDTYIYESNTAGTGNRSRLEEIELGVGGLRDYTFGSAGRLEQMAAGGNIINFSSDDEGRLAQLERLGNTASIRYDGRSFLERVDEVGSGSFTEPTYSSEGTLFSLFGSEDGGLTTQRRHVLYFAGRPVAILEVPSTGSETCTFLTTDHLGTPFVATDAFGAEVWSGGFEPFGRDWRAGTPDGAQENGVFLRFPGQWLDGTWEEASVGAEVAYNVHRWYEWGTGRYTRVDPQGLIEGDPHPYSYVASNPFSRIDPLGLRTLGFGGRFCVDSSCGCNELPPLKVLSEDSPTFVPLPKPGKCVDADAAYGPEGVIKIRDFGECRLRCDSSGKPKDVGCSFPPPIFYKCKDGRQERLPDGWPPNDLCL